ncbi:TPA: N-acetylmuramoyl-L-alanine amidase [Staphylococcus aureus]
MTEILDWTQKFAFGGPRPESKIRNIFIHTTENQWTTRAEDVALYQIRSQSGSYHRLVDRNKVVICNTDDWLTWSTGNYGNDIGLHLSFVAYAASTREQWLAEERAHGTITRAAEQVAAWSKKHNIPLVAVDGAGLRAGTRGVSTHNAARVWGNTDHTDPGAGFPMDVLLEKAKNLQSQAPTAKKEDEMFTDKDREKLDRIHHELTHRFDSRADLDAQKPTPFKDTAIGYALEADKKLELAPGTKLATAFDALTGVLKQIRDDIQELKKR